MKTAIISGYGRSGFLLRHFSRIIKLSVPKSSIIYRRKFSNGQRVTINLSVKTVNSNKIGVKLQYTYTGLGFIPNISATIVPLFYKQKHFPLKFKSLSHDKRPEQICLCLFRSFIMRKQHFRHFRSKINQASFMKVLSLIEKRFPYSRVSCLKYSKASPKSKRSKSIRRRLPTK